MLSRHVKPGGAKVVQLGGSTRDLYYYPKGTIQVIAVAPDLSVSLWEQGGMQAGVGVRAIKNDVLKALNGLGGSSVDSVVAFGQESVDVKPLVLEAWRVLKPGGTFVFIQPIKGGSLPGLVRLGNRGSATAAGR
jgi:hypothetical protein